MPQAGADIDARILESEVLRRSARIRGLDAGRAACYTVYYMKKKMLTVRLESEEERLLSAAARREGRPRSSVVREAIRRYATERLADSARTAHERLKPWIGKHHSGGMRLSERTGARFLALLRKKRRENDPR